MKQKMIGIVAIAVCFLAINAKAQDRSLRPGHDCRYFGKQGSDSFFSPSGTNVNGLKNTSTTARIAICALDKHPDYDTSSAWISFSGPTDDCSMYWRNPHGSSWGSWSMDSGVGNSPRTNAWTLGYDTNDKVVTLYCSVAPGVTINSYSHSPW